MYVFMANLQCDEILLWYIYFVVEWKTICTFTTHTNYYVQEYPNTQQFWLVLTIIQCLISILQELQRAHYARLMWLTCMRGKWLK